ncbi:CG31148, partial [Drosophila busckii]
GQTKTVPCKLKDAKYGKVCVCTADYCDYLENPTVSKDNEFALISSTKQGLRFAVSSGQFGNKDKYTIKDFEAAASQTEAANETIIERLLQQAFPQTDKAQSITRAVTLNVNRSQQFHKILGFGASFTGAVSYLLENYKEQALQDHLHKSYYAAEGLGFNLLRTSIGGCDFDLSAWAYNELPENDTKLTAMDKLDARDVIRVAQMKHLIEVSGVKQLKIKGAAWSSPKWMKTNNRWTGFGRLKRDYYQTWADYHLKWVDLMEQNGLPIWAISTGNEPMNGILFMFFVRFMSLGWTPWRQAVWLNDNLGPTIRNSKYKDLVIFGNDDQRYTSPYWFKIMKYARPNVLDYLDGVALHWYWDEIFGNSFVDKTNDYMADKLLIISESCIGDKPWQQAKPMMGSWERAEKMARSFLAHFNRGFHGWIDWNMILDELGGPNYVDNTVDAPVIANTTSKLLTNINVICLAIFTFITTAYTEFYKQPMFYIMGHFSKLVPEGSVRIEAVASNINLDSIAFERPDKQIVLVLFNSGRADLDININDTKRGKVTVNVPAKSIHTMLYK